MIGFYHSTSLLPKKQTLRGCPGWLKPQGLFGLMFLKHYTGLSDEKLIERFNTDWGMQLFCGTLLCDNERIRDNAFVSRIRSYIARHTCPEKIQSCLFSSWKGELKDSNVLLMDATCYESYIRFPTDVKLLWESNEWIWSKMIPKVCKDFKMRIPKSKFKDQKKKYTIYSKLRKKSFRKTKARKKALLHLLKKGIEALQQLLNKTKGGQLDKKAYETFATIKEVYRQQSQLFDHPKSKIKDRIVSIFKPYVRPIVRGKENKPVEFGLKVHMNQVDGINKIEYASFKNFNENTRLRSSILKHIIDFKSCTHISADRIYPTNANRNFITAKGIQSNFDRKGPRKEDKEEEKIKGILNKARSSYMEGSFGNEKNHYSLRKVKARTEKTELLWVYMGVLTANAVRIAKQRRLKESLLQQAIA